ncbi:hypothetical protein GUJ93_ZPchr0005g14531 [Zizania palustris]|uniref:Fatty acid desaturase domain-containing protein n=1 Tax=Zizania palustris TaxID=103762 RepID=A0A8J5VQU4_ZIZPA|nr:hypothetical protein GUJ93_ZPchr0005g14531 [Zizania palustris]
MAFLLFLLLRRRRLRSLPVRRAPVSTSNGPHAGALITLAHMKMLLAPSFPTILYGRYIHGTHHHTLDERQDQHHVSDLAKFLCL